MTDTPVGEVLVKGGGAAEHVLHRVADRDGRRRCRSWARSCSASRRHPRSAHTARVPRIIAGGTVIKRSIGTRFAADVLVKGGGAREHTPHSGHVAGVPVADVLVKGGGVHEHRAHSCHSTGVPRPDVLVKGGGAQEHIPHSGHVAGVPVADVLVKGGGASEHIPHIGHVAGVPVADVLVKGGGVSEHPLHRCHRTGVPVADVLVKIVGAPEHIRHTCHGAGVPVPVGPCARERLRTVSWEADPKHPRKVHPPRRWHATGIEDWWCPCDQIGGVCGKHVHVGASMKGIFHTGPRDGAPLINAGQF